jgi:hypothetical protein
MTKFDTYPGREKFTVDIDHYGVADGNYFYFDRPSALTLFPPGADQRSLPLFIPSGVAGTIHTEINLPPKFQQVVIQPKNESLTMPGGTSANVVRRDAPGKSVITDQFEIIPSIISPENYPKMLQIESTLDEKSAKLFLLEHK